MMYVEVRARAFVDVQQNGRYNLQRMEIRRRLQTIPTFGSIPSPEISGLEGIASNHLCIFICTLEV